MIELIFYNSPINKSNAGYTGFPDTDPLVVSSSLIFLTVPSSSTCVAILTSESVDVVRYSKHKKEQLQVREGRPCRVAALPVRG
jgi:hypothetical protein